MTSNIPAEQAGQGFGFHPAEGAPGQPAEPAMQQHFRKEFLNRIDEQMLFRDHSVRPRSRPSSAARLDEIGTAAVKKYGQCVYFTEMAKSSGSSPRIQSGLRRPQSGRTLEHLVEERRWPPSWPPERPAPGWASRSRPATKT